MSKFAPQNGDSGPLTKFGEFEALVEGPFSAKNGVQYFKLTINITPWINPVNPPTDPEESKVRTWKLVTAKWNQEYSEVFWPSIVQGNAKQGYALQPHLAAVLKSPDDLFTEPGQPAHRFYISYQTPELLVPATPADIEYARDHNTLDRLVQNAIGQTFRKRYPPKILQVYADFAAWNAAALANVAQQPAPPVVAPPQSNPEKEAALTAINQVFLSKWLTVKDGALTDVDMFALESDIQMPPFNKYFSLQSSELRALVARAIVAKTGHNMDALKGILLGTKNFLDIESPEIVAALEEVAF